MTAGRCTAILGLLASLAVLVSAGSASAATLAGPWAPFTNCPVDDPQMLAIQPGGDNAACVSSVSPNGSFKIGNTTLQTGGTSLQFGVAGSTPDDPTLGQIVPATDGMTLIADPVDVPGGVLGLMCPSNILLVSSLCRQATNTSLNRITAQVKLAGTPTDFSATGALSTGTPILTLPVKIQLQNPLLGSNCFIGSNSNPIVLRPQALTLGSVGSVIDPNGFPVGIIQITGGTLGDNSFAVPGATGCGPLGLANGAINSRQQLPSPAGQNELVQNDASASTALTGFGGQVLSDAWHASVVP
jgi:hypothetical protein